MNEFLIKAIDNLPPLPDTLVKLQSYIDSAGDDVQMQSVVDIISKDPLLTGDLLHLANSPYYGFSREISTLNQVVSLLGIDNVKNIAVANSLRGEFKVDVSPYGLNTQEFLGNCSREVDFISDWFSENDKKLSQILAPCAMLLRLGMMIYADTLIKKGRDKEFLEALKEINFSDVGSVETEFYGLDHLTFLGYLFDYWRFDDTLIQTTAYITAPHAASDEVKKNSYALAITTKVFDPYQGGSEYNMEDAVALIKEAKAQGIDFNMDRFLEILPAQARANIKQN